MPMKIYKKAVMSTQTNFSILILKSWIVCETLWKLKKVVKTLQKFWGIFAASLVGRKHVHRQISWCEAETFSHLLNSFKISLLTLFLLWKPNFWTILNCKSYGLLFQKCLRLLCAIMLLVLSALHTVTCYMAIFSEKGGLN